jgi:hypothetical protein
MILEKGELKKDRFKKVFYQYVGVIIIGALCFLLLGALLETWVLSNVTIYSKIILQSYGFA